MKADVLKKISVVFLVVAIAMILFFTFQAPDASLKLSEKVRGWLCNHGMEFNRFTFRTNVHLVEYFIVGIALTIYVKCHDYRCWIATAVGCGIGFLDESIKILLPGREFGLADLIRDFIGVGAAVMIVTLIIRIVEGRRKVI